jgi:hypothetical protein
MSQKPLSFAQTVPNIQFAKPTELVPRYYRRMFIALERDHAIGEISSDKDTRSLNTAR